MRLFEIHFRDKPVLKTHADQCEVMEEGILAFYKLDSNKQRYTFLLINDWDYVYIGPEETL